MQRKLLLMKCRDIDRLNGDKEINLGEFNGDKDLLIPITHRCVLWFGCRCGETRLLPHVATVSCPSWMTPVIR